MKSTKFDAKFDTKSKKKPRKDLYFLAEKGNIFDIFALARSKNT